MATLHSGSKNITIEYDAKDPVATREAWIQFLGCTEEEYDAQQAIFKKELDDLDAKYPNLKGLIWADDEMYYVDENGNRTDRQVNMEEISPEIIKSFEDLTEHLPKRVQIRDTETGEVIKEVDRVDAIKEELSRTKVKL